MRPLSPDADQLVQVAAVLGPSFSLDDAAEVLCQPVGRLLPVLREVVDAGLVAPRGRLLAFRDEGARQAIYEGVAEPVRVALHHQIGALLLDRGGSAAAAAHLVEGIRPGDRRALAGLDQAARELLASAPEAAARLGVRALELTGPGDQERFARAVIAVDALVAARRPAEAAELARATLALPAPPAAAEAVAGLRLALSSLLLMGGRPHAALKVAEAVLDEPGLPTAVIDRAELAQLHCLITGDGPALARERAEAILAGLDRPGGDGALAGALTVLALLAWREGRVAAALGLVRAAVRRARRAPVVWHQPRLGLAAILTAIGEFDEAADVLGEAGHEAAPGAADACPAAPAAVASRLHLAAGRLDAAEAEADRTLGLCEDMGTPLPVRLALTTLAEVALHKGDHHEASRQIQRCRRAPPSARTTFESASWVWAAARLAAARDGPDQAIAVLADVYDGLPARPALLLEQPAAAAWLVRVAHAIGDRERAEAVVACAEHLAATNSGFAVVVAAATHARGLLDRDASALARAAGGYRHPWASASASEDAGVVLAGGGDHDGARERLQDALAAYDRAGAEHDRARVRARLRDLGVRTSHWSRAERPVSGWASLTGTERRVAEAVAEGLTNAQAAERMFLSRHTVDFHLRQIFRKLDIRSRVELPRFVLEAQPPR